MDFSCLIYEKGKRKLLLTDKKLIKKAINGCNTSFRELINRYESLVAATVINMLGKCQQAEDVGQETFIRFYKNMGNFRGESELGTYLTRIAINLSLNELKKRKRENLLFKMDSEEIYKVPDNKREWEDKEEQEIVEKALQNIEPDFRQVVVLRMIDGFSIKETAEILNISEAAVISRLFRAQKKLKEILPVYMGEFV